MRRPTWRTAVVGGLLCGLFGVVLVRIGVALLLGGVRLVAVVVLAGIAWFVLRGRQRRG